MSSGTKLPAPGKAYDRDNEGQARLALEKADALNFKRGEDMRIEKGEKVIMKAITGGTRHHVYVLPTGRLCTEVTL